MSYASSAALQEAIYQRLIGDASLNTLVGSAIYDATPPGALPPLYVSLGPEDVRDTSDGSGANARHDFLVSVVADAGGFHQAKRVAAAISDALIDAPLTLTRGTLVGLWFVKAKAARSGNDDVRRIDLSFRALISGI